MDFSRFKNFAAQLSGSGLTPSQLAAKVSQSILDEAVDPNFGASAFATLLALCHAKPGEDVSDVVDDVLEAITNYADGGLGFTLVGPHADRLVYINFRTNSNHDEIFVNNNLVATKIEDTWIADADIQQALCYSDGDTITDTDIQAMIQSSGSAYALGALLNSASNMDWSKSETASAFSAMVSDYTVLSGQLASNIKQAAADGLTCVTGVVLSLYNNLQSAYEVAQSSDGYAFVSDSVTVNQFAWGMIARAISVAAMAISLAISAISRVIGAIVAVIGTIASWISQLVATVAETAAGTRYSVDVSTSCPSFSFVLRRYTITSGILARRILMSNNSTAMITGPELPCTLICQVTDPESANPSTIYVEEVPSANFDLLATAVTDGTVEDYHSAYASDSSRGLFYCWARTTYGSDPGYRYFPTFGFDQTANLNNIIAGAWSPIDLSKYSIISGLWENDNPQWTSRLASGLFLWALSYLRSFLSYCVEVAESNSGICLMTQEYQGAGSGSPLNYIQGCLANVLLVMGCKLAERIRMAGVGNTPVDLTTEDVDYIITQVGARFDGLNWTNKPFGEIIPSVAYVLPADSNTVNVHLVSTPTETVTLIGEAIEQAYTSTILAASILSTRPEYIYGCRIDYPSISLPKATFKAFVSGLLIDALIVIAAGVAAVGVVIARFKIANRQAMLQAQAERNWYAYQDGLGDPNLSASDRQDLWKAYKRSRLKYNVGAFLTGGTTLGLGLYDDGLSTELSGPDYSVADILTLIRGKRNI